MRTMLKSKLQRGTVTEANIEYEGSITIDPLLMKSADILAYEQVHVLDIDNGARLVTYAIEGRAGSGELCVNGAAAKRVHKGDKVIILTYHHVQSADALHLKPRLVYLTENNEIERIGNRDRVAAPEAG